MRDFLWEDLPDPPKQRATVDLWASFFANEKLTVNRVPIDMLLRLADLLVTKGLSPKVRPYSQRLESRRQVCIVAMDNGIDLPAYKHNGKPAMSRGLLDAWNKAYVEKYGSNYGTSGVREATRRDVKTKLSQRRDNETKNTRG